MKYQVNLFPSKSKKTIKYLKSNDNSFLHILDPAEFEVLDVRTNYIPCEKCNRYENYEYKSLKLEKKKEILEVDYNFKNEVVLKLNSANLINSFDINSFSKGLQNNFKTLEESIILWDRFSYKLPLTNNTLDKFNENLLKLNSALLNLNNFLLLEIKTFNNPNLLELGIQFLIEVKKDIKLIKSLYRDYLKDFNTLVSPNKICSGPPIFLKKACPLLHLPNLKKRKIKIKTHLFLNKKNKYNLIELLEVNEKFVKVKVPYKNIWSSGAICFGYSTIESNEIAYRKFWSMPFNLDIRGAIYEKYLEETNFYEFNDYFLNKNLDNYKELDSSIIGYCPNFKAYIYYENSEVYIKDNETKIKVNLIESTNTNQHLIEINKEDIT